MVRCTPELDAGWCNWSNVPSHVGHERGECEQHQRHHGTRMFASDKMQHGRTHHDKHQSGCGEIRMTAVFHREDGAWKIVQCPASLGVRNAEAIGTDLITE